MSGPASAVRGCGTRTEGGIYAETRLGSGGSPISSFLIDPPRPCDMESLGVSPIGVTLFKQGDVTHIIDYVGADSYPNVTDFIEEVFMYGASRKLSPLLDYSALSPKSRLMLVHGRAIIENWVELSQHIDWRNFACPKSLFEHSGTDGMLDQTTGVGCLGFSWQTIEHFKDFIEDPRERHVVREMPSFSYSGWHSPMDFEPKCHPGFFFSLPITNITVIRSETGEHEEAMKKVAPTTLPVLLEDS